VSHCADDILKISRLQKVPWKTTGSNMNTKATGQSCFAMAMRTITARDVYLSLGLAALVVTLTSVMGSM
jgi:hypothetical protein